MNKDNCKVVVCEKKDLADLIDFIKGLDSDNTINLIPSEEYILWKYKRLDLPSHIKLLKYDNNIVGLSGVVGEKIISPDGIVDFLWGVDLFILPQFRKLQFVNSLIKKGDSGLMLTFADGDKVSLLFRKSGWRILPSYIFVLRRYNNIKSALEEGLGLSFSISNHFSDDFSSFFNRVSSQYSYIIYRDLSYLNWRYHHPFNKYTVISVRKKGKVSGYAVVRKETDSNKGYILDMLADLRDEKVIYSLVVKAISYLQKEKAQVIFCLLSHPKYIQIFKRLGFVLLKKGNCLFRGENKLQEIDILKRKSEIYFSLGDGDYRGGL